MSQLYEGMFLLDNQVVREDWKAAKAIVTDTLQKHGAKVLAARRWDERKLAYPIRRRLRGTYCLAFYELPTAGIPTVRRDLDLNESVLRYLMVKTPALPQGELDLAAAENAAGFDVPPPPPDDAPDAPPMRRGPAEGEEPEAEVPPDLEAHASRMEV